MATAESSSHGSPPERVRWRGWVDTEPSSAPIVIVAILGGVTLLAGAFASAENCGPGGGNECQATPIVTLGALALIVLVFSPWLAAWWARRVATQRRRRREARLQPHQNQLRDWFANGLFSEAEYRRTRERIARSIDGATTGELNHSIGQFLQAWATLILVGGLVFVGSFVLVALDTDAWQPLLTTAGIVLVGVVAGTVLLAIAGAAARRNATTRLRADSEELDGLLDELAIRIARPPKAKR